MQIYPQNKLCLDVSLFERLASKLPVHQLLVRPSLSAIAMSDMLMLCSIVALWCMSMCSALQRAHVHAPQQS